jgi:hypothetical protein
MVVAERLADAGAQALMADARALYAERAIGESRFVTYRPTPGTDGNPMRCDGVAV